jgi:hypothetical protein
VTVLNFKSHNFFRRIARVQERLDENTGPACGLYHPGPIHAPAPKQAQDFCDQLRRGLEITELAFQNKVLIL